MLTSPGWHPRVRLGLERFIRRHAGQGCPVAFDFDNTVVTGDIGEATLAVLVRRGQLTAEGAAGPLSPAFRNRAGRLTRVTSGSDLTAYYEALLSATVHGEADPQAYATGYVWAAEVLAGLPLHVVTEATAEAFRAGSPGEIRRIEATPGRTGYSAPYFNPEMVELIACLLRHAFVPWVVSASNVWSVRWMVQFGLNPLLQAAGLAEGIPPQQVVGVGLLLADRGQRLYKDAILVREDEAYASLDPAALKRYRLTTRLQFPVPVYAGKVACLWDALGRAPALAAGDSPGDHAMLAFAKTRLWIARLDKPDYQAGAAALAERTGRRSWLVQPTLAHPRPGFHPDFTVPAGASGGLRAAIRRSGELWGAGGSGAVRQGGSGAVSE